jgi:hypothetical protein
MWPCWFILLFISGVPSARWFYFFIRSVRAFGTTQSLWFISFTKPSMTTLPSSSSNIKPCFLFEWNSRAFDLILNTILKSLFYFICFVLVASSARKSGSITKTGKWLKLLTLPLPISKCLQVSTMFASLTAGLIKKEVSVMFYPLVASCYRFSCYYRFSDILLLLYNIYKAPF